MYELEKLYTDLKYQTLKESYVSKLNSVCESSFDEAEAKQCVKDTMKCIDEEIKIKKAKLFDKRKKGVVTAKKLLSKFKSTAQNAKPYGLKHEGFRTFKTDEEIKQLHETAIAYLEQFDPRTASGTEVKLFISDIGDNVQYKGLQTIFGEKCSKEGCKTEKCGTKEGCKSEKCGEACSSKNEKCSKEGCKTEKCGTKEGCKSEKCATEKCGTKEGCKTEKCSSKGRVVCNKENKELTKEDINKAILYLENFNEDFSKYNIVRESYNTYGLSPERKIAANYKSALMAIADSKYYDMMSQKLTLEFAQASQIVTKASLHNPRNLRESKEVQEYIDFLYEYEV